MKAVCPHCHNKIATDDINVSADRAVCRVCDEIFALSKITAAEPFDDVDLRDPPSGAWFQEEIRGFTVGATARSCVALFLVPFTCVWSGLSLGGIYGTQIAEGKFNLGTSLFGIPFLLGTILLVTTTLMSLFGKVSVTVDGDDAVAFDGIGPIGRRRRFNWPDVRTVREETTYGNKDHVRHHIVIDSEDEKSIKLGSMLSEARRHFMIGVLRQKLESNRRRF